MPRPTGVRVRLAPGGPDSPALSAEYLISVDRTPHPSDFVYDRYDELRYAERDEWIDVFIASTEVSGPVDDEIEIVTDDGRQERVIRRELRDYGRIVELGLEMPIPVLVTPAFHPASAASGAFMKRDALVSLLAAHIPPFKVSAVLGLTPARPLS